MNWTSVCFDWNRARAFLVTSEEGSLSAAAKALGMTQPTLSRQVSALERELGVMLFERVGQRLELTQSGLELLEHARQMGAAAQAFSLSAQGQSQTLEGTVVVSVSESDAVYRLPKIIAKLRQAEPGIDIETVVTNQVSDLKRREADIAIRSFRPTQPDLIVRKIGEELIWLYGTEGYLQPYADIQRLDEIQNIEIIGFNRSEAMITPLNQQGWHLSQDNIKLVTSFQPMQISLCREGLGLIYLPEYIGDQEPMLNRAFPSFGPILRLPIWLVCHQELRTNPRVRRVYDFIANCIDHH